MKNATVLRPSEYLIDELMDVYVDWREACVEVHAAYQGWCSAPSDDRAPAYVAYCTALDCEAAAAARYRSRFERLLAA